MSDWLAGFAGGARGASQGLGDLIAILDRANAEKKADARYADERDYRNRSLDADLAKSGYFPADDTGGLPAIDKNIRAAGRPNLVTMAAERGAPERSAPSSLFDGVDISGILSRAASEGGDPPIGLDPTTAGKDLHQVGDPNAPALPSTSPTPRTNVGNSPVHRALALAGQTEPQQSVSIGGKKYIVDPDRTPEGRRATAQLAKEQASRAAKANERRSILQQLRRNQPQKYGNLTDEVIDAASGDDAVYQQLVLNKDDPAALHAKNRDYDVAHPLPVTTPDDRTSAQIMKDVAENQTTLATIDKALAALAKHPDAVGLKRGLADIPLVGQFGDKVNQRVDPSGVETRALIANVGSLVIKQRSGQAVTVSESGRLRPFIPSDSDTPASIRTKLGLLSEQIKLETSALQQQAGRRVTAPAVAPKDGGGDISLGADQPSEAQQLWDQAVAKHGRAKVLKEFGPRPDK